MQNRVVKVQSTSTLPVNITGMDKKGYVGEILSRVFDPLGKIRNEFILALQSLGGSSNQNLKWDGNKFVYGSISNSGSYVGI